MWAKNGASLDVTSPDEDPGGRFAGAVPPAYNAIDFEFSWGNTFDSANWTEPNRKKTALLSVVTRPSAVLAVVFSGLDFANDVLLGFIVIACLLAAVELISVAIGFGMTRTITGAVHNLYEGTRRVGQGDFLTASP